MKKHIETLREVSKILQVEVERIDRIEVEGVGVTPDNADDVCSLYAGVGFVIDSLDAAIDEIENLLKVPFK